MFLPLVASIVALLFLPNLIPAHYNIDNKVDRWGSKYEILIFPVVTILFGQFLLLMGRIAKKQEVQGNNNEKNGWGCGYFFRQPHPVPFCTAKD